MSGSSDTNSLNTDTSLRPARSARQALDRVDAASRNKNNNTVTAESGAKKKEEKQTPWARPRKSLGKKNAEDESVSFCVKGEPLLEKSEEGGAYNVSLPAPPPVSVPPPPPSPLPPPSMPSSGGLSLGENPFSDAANRLKRRSAETQESGAGNTGGGLDLEETDSEWTVLDPAGERPQKQAVAADGE